MRTILKRRELGDPSASLAIDIYVHRLQKYIGAYFAILGGLDALLFTAGVGENSSVIRELVTANLSHLGLSIDPVLNRSLATSRQPHDISASGSSVATLVVPTDEETAIARAARSLGQP
jgi:acetate kinase